MKATLTASLCLALAASSLAMPDAYIAFSRQWSNDMSIYMWNTGTGQVYRLFLASHPGWKTDGTNRQKNPSPAVFSPDGKQLALISKVTNDAPVDTGSLFVVNNDGTGLTRVCATFGTSTGLSFCNICWTDQGIFWTENTRSIYWADPQTGQSKVLGTLATNTTGNHLRMSRAGTRAYLRTDHTIGDLVGGLYFEVSAGAGGIVNERPFGANLWDHGSAMLNDGSGAIWVVWNCGSYGNPAGCVYHKYFAIRDFVNMSTYTMLLPGDGLAACYELSGPGDGPYTTPSSGDHILYGKYANSSCSGSPGHYLMMNIKTRETVDVTPTDDRIAAGGPTTTLGSFIAGEFWLGALPNPHATAPSIVISKTALRFSDLTAPIPADTVVVTNAGAGTLGTVSAVASPAASWLTLQVVGTGNTQRVVARASAAGQTSGDHTTTVTVSGGGADNSRTFTVTLTVGAQVLAPSGLAAVVNGARVDLTWSDNSGSETGFTIQRATGAGAFSQLVNVGANVETFVDTAVVRGTTYAYRVRAYTASATSAWSDTATAQVPLPPIVVTAPAQGDTVRLGGQCHIRWTAPSIQVVQIEYSINDGESWVMITAAGGVTQSSPNWGDYVWTVPLALGQQASVLVRVAEYQNLAISTVSGAFRLMASSGLAGRAASRSGSGKVLAARHEAGAIVFSYEAPAASDPAIAVYDAQGRCVSMLAPAAQAGSVRWAGADRGSGLYLARLTAVDSRGERRVLATLALQGVR